MERSALQCRRELIRTTRDSQNRPADEGFGERGHRRRSSSKRVLAWVWAVYRIVVVLVFANASGATAADAPTRPQILVHYMPWFVSKPPGAAWGWHWTMNAFEPEKTVGEKRRIASHYYPLIGPYDSSDPAVVEYHFLLMKLAGIDGIIVDWYGLANKFDYPVLHRNTAALFPQAAATGLKIGICYEDQTISTLVELGDVAKNDRAKHAKDVIAWLQKNWFVDPSYLTFNGRPVLLSFGFGGLTDPEWDEALPKGSGAPMYLSEHRRRSVAAGAFDWPVPKSGLAQLDRFERDAKAWAIAMPAAYPRFHDIYSEAKVHASYGSIPDDRGRTFVTTLRRALVSGAPLVQIVTWNDWGEGTVVEPSVEFGYRDLEAVQRLRRELVDPKFARQPGDLRQTHRLYTLRRKQAAAPGTAAKLDEIASQLSSGQVLAATDALDRIEGRTP